mgnify:CR=1 FL=1
MSKHQNNLAERLVDAMLAHVAEYGWRGTKLEAVEERAGLSPGEAYEVCPGRAQLLNMFARRIDLVSVADAGPVPNDFEARYDQLLDILMLRFEALNPYRMAVSQVLTDVAREPETLFGVLPQSQRSFAFLAGAAGFPSGGWQGAIFAKALSVVWLTTQHVWLEDESIGQSATMAALDRNLRCAVDTLEPVLGRSFRDAQTEEKG